MGEPHLLDTNVLLRLTKRDHPEFTLARGAVAALRRNRAPLYYTLQNMAEFWNACTRPIDRNGFGLSIAETEIGAREIDETFTFLPDTIGVYREWRSLVFSHNVKGVQVHDARLVAILRAYGMRHLLTLNGADFRRYGEVVVVTPENLVEER